MCFVRCVFMILYFYMCLCSFRASSHLEAVVATMLERATAIPEDKKQQWRLTILDLVREVVVNVDPDVRGGDSLDIRPYVKIKTIPGGSPSETTYIDGVVFRKNVAHKKMLAIGAINKPKLLLIRAGLEFRRLDSRLMSMDTLVEQENKFTELLIKKLMLLKPDIILVGKSVSRRALELLLAYKVVVMQNVKNHLLDRIA